MGLKLQKGDYIPPKKPRSMWQIVATVMSYIISTSLIVIILLLFAATIKMLMRVLLN